MARPDYIANLHAAKYDLRFCSGPEKPAMCADTRPRSKKLPDVPVSPVLNWKRLSRAILAIG